MDSSPSFLDIRKTCVSVRRKWNRIKVYIPIHLYLHRDCSDLEIEQASRLTNMMKVMKFIFYLIKIHIRICVNVPVDTLFQNSTKWWTTVLVRYNELYDDVEIPYLITKLICNVLLFYIGSKFSRASILIVISLVVPVCFH